MDLEVYSCTGSVISGGQVVHEALSCPLHPEVAAYAAGVAAGKREQYALMVGALDDTERYKEWHYNQQQEPAGYLERFHRYLARHYLDQTTNPDPLK